MSAVNVTSVQVQNNPAAFLAPLAFEIEYECLTALADDLEWKMTYVGSAESEDYDQVLDSVLLGPVLAGNYRFVFEGNPPDPARLPPDDVVGVTVIFLTCSYHSQEFLRIGYYINVEYQEEELRENPPERPLMDRLWRNVLADQPRVTRFPVDFDNAPGTAAAAASAEAANTAMEEDGGSDLVSEGMLQQMEAAGRSSGFAGGALQAVDEQMQPPMPGMAEGPSHYYDTGVVGAC